MSKIIIAIILLIIAIGLGAGSSHQLIPASKEEIKDEISTLLESLKEETGIVFSEIEELEFEWIIKVDPEVKYETVTGKGFEAERISDEQYDSIEQFLINNGFEVNLYNISSGLVAESVGYKKEKMVCAVSGGITGYKEAEFQWDPSEISTKDVMVNCGELEKTAIEYETENQQEQACVNSGGTVIISSCCKSTEDYPNLCLVGPCGCSPDNSREVKICDCGSDKCFNGNECVVLENK